MTTFNITNSTIGQLSAVGNDALMKNEIVLVTYDEFMGDWQALYVNNKLVYDAYYIELEEFLEHTNLSDGTPFSFKSCVILNTEDFEQHESSVPPTLDGVELQDAAEYWERRSNKWG